MRMPDTPMENGRATDGKVGQYFPAVETTLFPRDIYEMNLNQYAEDVEETTDQARHEAKMEKTPMEDIKSLFDDVAMQNKQVTFMLADQIIKDDGFPGLNALLATGEIPGMLNKDDCESMAL